jgi:hypothetical protein
MTQSSAVTSGQSATSTQYNNLRDDVISTSTGHSHDGTNARNDQQFIINVAGLPLIVENTTDATANQLFLLRGDNATRADNDEIYITLSMDDDGGNSTEFSRMTVVATDVSNGSEDGRIDWAVVTAGTLADELRLDGATLSPSTSDGLALGTAALMWADLFIASGGVLNFNNGDVTVTHSSNTLTVAGGNIALGANSLTAGSLLANSNDVGAIGASGTAWSDLFLASGAVMNFNGGDVTITHSANTLTFDGGGVVFNEAGADHDFRVESDENPCMIEVDASLASGRGTTGLGRSPDADSELLVGRSQAFTATADTNHFRMEIASSGAVTVPSGTTAIVAALKVNEPNITATGTVTNGVTLYVAAPPSEGTNNYSLWVDSGLVRFDDESLFVDGTGFTAIGDSANASMTVGLTIEQAGNDNEILALKSSDVAHGMTDFAETDTYASFKKASGSAGGLTLQTFTEGAESFFADIYYTNDNTTKSESGDGPAIFRFRKRDGTGAAVPGADANLFLIATTSGVKWMVDEDGDTFLLGTADTSLDAFDDWQLAAGYQALTVKNAPPVSYYKRYWGNTLKDAEDFLVKSGVLTARLSEGGMTSTASFNGLTMDLFRASYERFKEQDNRIAELEGKLLALGAE